MKIKKTDRTGMEYARRQRSMADELRRRRKRLGLPLTAVARAANVSYCSLWAFESGRNVNATFSLLTAYAEAVGMELRLCEANC